MPLNAPRQVLLVGLLMLGLATPAGAQELPLSSRWMYLLLQAIEPAATADDVTIVSYSDAVKMCERTMEERGPRRHAAS